MRLGGAFLGPISCVFLLASCATTRVPQLNPAQLHHPRLAIERKVLRVEVRDTRTPPADDNGKSVEVVRDALVKVLADSGVNVSADDRQVLTVTVGYFDQPPPGFDRESCVELTGRLLAGAGPVEARSFGCYATGDGANQAYSTAMNNLLDELEKRSGELAKNAPK